MNRLAMLFVLIVSSSAFASQPGQPLDCSDWVFLEPGYSCSVWTALPCEVDENSRPTDLECVSGNERAFDNLGRRLRLQHDCTDICPIGTGSLLCRVHLFARRDGTETEIAYIGDRCTSAALAPMFDRVFPGAPTGNQTNGKVEGRIVFDAQSGRLLVPLRAECVDDGSYPDDCRWPPTLSTQHKGYWVASIGGFTPLHEVAQSFVPTVSSWVFREPLLPDGLAGVDHFDSYWGAVRQPFDLADAQPLQCAYPSVPASPGDYLQITAPVPTPAPGAANYILTRVTYQGQTRAGRRASGGRLTGRDASRLPACITE